MPAFAGMTESWRLRRFSTNCSTAVGASDVATGSRGQGLDSLFAIKCGGEKTNYPDSALFSRELPAKTMAKGLCLMAFLQTISRWARERKRGKGTKAECYLCGGVATTRDHVPPRGLFPAPRPHNLVTVPACESCNRGSSLHDEYFRVTVASGSRDSSQSIALLHQRILPRMRQNPALIAELMKSMRWTAVRSEGGIYLGRAPAFPIDRPRIQAVIEKIVKGLYYKHKKRRLPDDQIVAPYMYNPPIEKPFQEEIGKLPLQDIGDGTVFSYRYCTGDGPSPVSYWFLMFYNDTTLFITQTLPASNPQVNADAAPASSAAPVT